MLKHKLNLTASNIKKKLQNWIIDDSVAKDMEKELQKLQISDEMSESVIERKISESEKFLELMKTITSSPTIIQNHSGIGDNVAGNKITNN